MKLYKHTLTEEQKKLENEFGVSFYITTDKKLWLKTNKKYDDFILKNNNKSDIYKLATLSDQLNLLSNNLNIVIDELIKINPSIANNTSIVKGKKVLFWIKEILSI